MSKSKKQKKSYSLSLNNRIGLMVAMVAVSLIGVYAAVTSHAAGSPAQPPVVYVHGYLFNACPGEKPSNSTVFGSEANLLKAQGYTGSADYIDYYACDSGGSNIAASGSPTAYYAGGAMQKNGLNNATTPGGASDSTDIRHISYQLAWYVYDKYSSKGQSVNLVSHSMGGLITSWMLFQIQSHNSLFPPYLYVNNAVTISTPFGGVNDGYNNVSWCPSSTQCTQLKPGSDFINQLQAGGMNYQATNGTVWTAVGGSPCDTVNNPAGTTMLNGSARKVNYYAKRGQTPVCYSHTSYLTDTSAALNMPAQLSSDGTGYVTVTNAPHALLAVARAVMAGR